MLDSAMLRREVIVSRKVGWVEILGWFLVGSDWFSRVKLQSFPDDAPKTRCTITEALRLRLALVKTQRNVTSPLLYSLDLNPV